MKTPNLPVFSLVALAILLIGAAPSGAQTSLVAPASVWKYLDGGIAPGPTWTNLNYDDSAWRAGPGPLGNNVEKNVQLVTTVIDIGPTNAPYPSVVFRKSFIVPDTSVYGNLIVRLQRDDGAVVYLNGLEVVRNGVTNGSSLTNYASQNVSGTNETNYTSFSVPGAALVTGPNVLAVEVHQANSLNAVDLAFDLELLANHLPSVALTNPTDGQTLTGPTDLTLSASAADSDGTVMQVEFFQGSTSLGGQTNAPFRLVWTNVTDSLYTLSAVATDNLGGRSTSTPVTINIIDPRPPTVASVIGTTNQVTVIFSKRVTLASATNLSNYAINNGVTVTSAALSASATTVQLSTSPLLIAQPYILTVNGIADNDGNPLTATNVTFMAFTLQDIGSPSIAGSAAASSAGGFGFRAGGSDIGGASDQFSFEFEQRSGDFDVKVRLASLDLSDVWAKAGLMAREFLTSTSRFAAVLTTPSASGTFFESRSTTSGVATMAGSFPVNYPYTWLRLRRAGNGFTGYASWDGQNWSQLSSATLALPPTIYFGRAVSSHNVSQSTTAQFRDLGDVSGGTVGNIVRPHEPLGPSSRRTGLVISEIMYHPRSVPIVTNGATNNLTLEFIELYNAQPYFESIGGYSISGDVNYTFPQGAVLPAGGFLVLAKVAAEVQAYYGLTANPLSYGITQYVTNAVGGVTTNIVNSLSNGGGLVRLLNRQKAVLLEVNYGTRNPWPVSADGAGHSLVLARPSYGEGDPRAWAASDAIDGSPGAADPVGPEPARSVVLNEFLANSQSPVEDFIELYNHSNVPVDISGCYLSDSPTTNLFRIPDRTVIPARGYVAFTQTEMGFALNGEGESIFLVNSNQTRVLDALAFNAQAAGVSSGRVPDGADTFRELANRTPGAANSSCLKSDVVINEIMFSPISGDSNDQYVELYNKGISAVDIGGWRFIAGISFTFPSNTVLAANGYLAVAKNTARMLSHYPNLNAANLLGNFGGTLSHGGERLALAMPETHVSTSHSGKLATNTIYVVANEVTYSASERWGIWANGGGSSMELIDPESDNQQAANWADSDESNKSQWSTFGLTGTIGETLGSPVNDNLQVFLLGVGECLIDGIQVNNASSVGLLGSAGTFETGMAGWVPQGSHDQSTIENEGYGSSKSLHIRAASRGDNGGNRIRSPAFNPAAAGSITLSATARWLRGWPEVLLRVHGGGLEMTGQLPVPNNLGTPGARNSRAVSNAGPAIYEVSHSPVLPAANQPVVVTARASDPDGLSSLALNYRIDPAAIFTTVAMRDDGLGGDAIAGDGIYSATMPGQATNAYVAFYIQAIDNAPAPATNIFPKDALTRSFPSDAPSHECVVRFGEPQMPGSFATYHLWLTSASSNRWTIRDHLNNSLMDGTFVYNDCRVIYNMEPNYGGSPWHRGQMTTGPAGDSRVDFASAFPKDEPFLGATDATWCNPGNPGGNSFSDLSMQSEQASYAIFNGIGVVYNYRHYMHLFINGSQRSAIPGRSGNMLFEDAQQPNGDMVQEWHPDDPNGQLFKIEDWFEFDNNGYDFTSNNDADLTRRTTLINGLNQVNIANYRFMWRRRSVATGESATDYTNFLALLEGVSPAANPNASPMPNAAQIEGVANIEQWMRIFACQHTVGNWDSYGFSRGKNDYTYKGVNGRFEQMTWDIDFTMGLGGNGTTDPLIQANDPRVMAMWATPAFVRYYWNAFQDIINGPLNNSFLDPILDAKAAAMGANNINYDPSQVATIKAYVKDRRAFLASQLSSVAANFAVNGNTAINTDSNLVTFTGTAPVTIRTIQINGTAYPITWTTVTIWSMTLPVNVGTNQLVFQAYDRLGNAITNAASFTKTVVYGGAAPDPKGAVVINEIMFNPLVPDAEFVELYNVSTHYTFDLSGWVFNGLNYTFPTGSFIRPAGFLVLAKDRSACTYAYGGSVRIFDVFGGNLQAAGETLTLVRPGATAAEDEVIDKVRYESVLPWPVGTNGVGTASSIQLIDPTQDNSRPGNWSTRYSPPVWLPATNIVGRTNSGWHFVSITGTNNGTNAFFLYLDGPGNVYIDDLSVVDGTTAGVGFNFVAQGDFEGPVLDTSLWLLGTNYINSGVSSDVAHSGSNSLHIICTTFGNILNPLRVIEQVLSPTPTNGEVCTLSFWYYATPFATNVVFRFATTASTLKVITNVQPTIVPDKFIPAQLIPAFVSATPGAVNTGATNILPAIPPLWLNEVQPDNLTGISDNAGQHDPWLELYNAGANTLPLDGYFLANNYTNLSQWAFPAGTVINPGEFKVIFADGEANESTPAELHTSFGLSSRTGSIALSRLYNGQPQVLDYLNYQNVTPGSSYGSFPDGQPFTRQEFHYVTPGATNNGAIAIFINEWMASNTRTLADLSSGSPKYDDWFELYNPAANPVSLGGYYLTDTLSDQFQYRIPAGYTVPAGGYLLIWADNEPTQNSPDQPDLHVNFQLSKGGEAIGLFAADGAQIDAVTFGPQTNDVSMGRCPDGGPSIVFLAASTPRSANTCEGNNTSPVLQPISDHVMTELTRLKFTVLATDADIPVQTLTFSLDAGAPAGASITTDGFFKWRPAELQGPGVYSITVRVVDNGTPNLSATQTFTVTVNETNSAPSFIDVRDKYVKAGALLSFRTGVDSDWPVQNLSFSMDAGAAQGATIGPASGVFSWTPSDAQAPGTYPVVVHVSDDGVPPQSAVATYNIHLLGSSANLILMDFSRAGNSIQINFQSTIGKTYQVLYKDALSAPDWTVLGASFVAGASTTTIADNLGAHPQRFYRIVALD